MLMEIEKEYEEKLQANLVGRYFYMMGPQKTRQYFEDLYNLGQCKPFPPVIFDIFEKNSEILENDFDNLRNQVYEVIDNYTYKFHLTGETKREKNCIGRRDEK